MASLSLEEENYIRMSLLLTGISPRAVRTCFDNEFAPVCLDASLKKEYNKLITLKKERRINQSQWNLLFPRFPDVPDSKTFDVTLMTALLRNLTQMIPPLCGFDRLPSTMETTQPADLTRIKHYRNYLAHLDDSKIDIAFFNTAWHDITGAITRLGGEQMKQECDRMKTKPLDQTNKEIMIDIKHSNNEIRELKESLESLKLSHTEMKKSHGVLQEKHAVVTKQIEEVKIVQRDTVPWNIRVRINDTLKAWKDDDKRFINTRAAQYVLKCIQENRCVTVTASSGVGKTSILRHTALKLAEEYDVLLITEPSDIMRFYNPNTKILFVIDNLCGNFSVDLSDIKRWEPVMKDLKQIFFDEKQTKILAACRLQIYQDDKFDSLSVFKSCVCNILSKNICLSKDEKDSLARLYLKEQASTIGKYYDLYDCFPLLCKLYNGNPKLNVSDLFQNPFSVYEAEIKKLWKKGYYTKYCALALCVMFNNKLNEAILTDEVNEATKTIIENTCEVCRLDRGTSRLLLQSELDLFTHTFIKKEQNVYGAIHDKIFDFLVYFFGQNIVCCLIKYADIDLIKERFAFERKGDMDQFITIIPQKFHQIYLQRMIDDWSKGNVQGVFGNTNMKIPQFRKTFLEYLYTFDISYQRQLATICDNSKPFSTYDSHDTFETALLYSCYLGDISLIEWCCNHVVDMKRCAYAGKSPLMIGCIHGHKGVVKVLLERGSGEDCNQCDAFGKSPVMMASENGHLEIVKMLLLKGVNCNKCDWRGVSPVMKACKLGHTKIAEILILWGADCNICNKNGQSPLLKACKQGHTEIVKMLLNRGADCNECDSSGHSPLLKACEQGHTKIVKMLLNRGADWNKSNSYGHIPLLKAIDHNHASTEIVKMLLDKGAGFKLEHSNASINLACQFGHTEIVKMLLDREARCNICSKSGQSYVMVACNYGYTETVKMLLDRGADCDTCDLDEKSLLTKACERGHTDIVKLLLERGADLNKLDRHGCSPLMIAYINIRTKIVKMLIDRGADCNTCDSTDRSVLMIACEQNRSTNSFLKTYSKRHEVYATSQRLHDEYVESVKMLVEHMDNIEDCNKFDKSRQSPLMSVCEHGQTDILKIFLDKGADCNICDDKNELPMMKACQKGHKEIVNMLLDRGADYNKCDRNDKSPVMKACKRGHTEIVKMLLDRGADYNKCNKMGESPVMKTCARGHTEIVKMLLDRGADYYKCDKSDKSPVMKACEKGHTELVNILLDRGADYNKCDEMGESPIMKTCKQGHLQIIKMLLDKGAEYNKRNMKGQSPVQKACQHGHTEIVKILIDRGADYNKSDLVAKHCKNKLPKRRLHIPKFLS